MDSINELILDICAAIANIMPFASIREYSFMHLALVGLLLIAPLCATIGIQVINFRLAFFSEAIGHSAFTGLGIGLAIMAFSETVRNNWYLKASMIIFGVIVAMGITAYRRNSGQSSDTVIGVFSSLVIAIGLSIYTHLSQTGKLAGNFDFLDFLKGNILTIEPEDILVLFVFFLIAMTLQFLWFNKLFLIGLNRAVAQTMGIGVRFYDYAFACLLALIVMFSIQAVGVLLITAMLVIPAASARCFASSAGSVFWVGLLIAESSCIGGLVLADTWNTGVSSMIILCSSFWFVIGILFAKMKGREI